MSRKKATSKNLAKQASEFASERYGIVIPWEMIIGLVEWFMSECAKTEKQFTKLARHPTWYQSLVLRHEACRRLRRDGYGRRKSRRGAWAASDAIFTIVEDSDDATLGRIFRELE